MLGLIYRIRKGRRNHGNIVVGFLLLNCGLIGHLLDDCWHLVEQKSKQYTCACLVQGDIENLVYGCMS